MRITIAAAIALAAAPAAAEPGPELGVRLSGGAGVLDELTWSAPEVDVAVRHRVGPLWLGAAVGYAPIDNHTFLSDARVVRVAADAAIARGRLRLAGVASLEHVAFHADPDVLADLPATDLLRRRSNLLPAAGVEASVAVEPRAALGIFARVSATRVELTGTGDGGVRRARLALIGAFAEYRL